MTTHERILRVPPGIGREVGHLFAALEETRRRTREAVHGMATELLDARLDGFPNRIGALLFHVAGIENWFVDRVLLQRPRSELERNEFAAADLGAPEAAALVGHDVAYYLAILDEVRAQTESACWSLKDDALDAAVTVAEADLVASPRYALSFLIDHEAHHRGQIELLKRATGASRA